MAMNITSLPDAFANLIQEKLEWTNKKKIEKEHEKSERRINILYNLVKTENDITGEF
tara:strand:- start:448 stop:618 length:171 start_codon:yes stop_codon:yes gene_type:complete